MWLHDLSTPIALPLSADSAHHGTPLWSPSDRDVAFASTRDGRISIFRERTHPARHRRDALHGFASLEHPKDGIEPPFRAISHVSDPAAAPVYSLLKVTAGSTLRLHTSPGAPTYRFLFQRSQSIRNRCRSASYGG